MDQKFTRRRLLGTGAALAAAAPLSALPFPTGIEPAPVMADTTKTELTDDDRDWMAQRVTRTEFGERVIGSQPPRRQWSYDTTALYIRHDTPDYHPIYEFIRRSRRQQDDWQARRSVRDRAAWVWSVPEPLRAGLLAVIDDIADTADMAITNALPNVLYNHLHDQLGVTVDEIEDDDWEDQEPSDADKLRAWRQPTTIGVVLLAISAALEIDPDVWLNDGDLALLRQAT